jgi:hypothetical protein
MVDRVTRLAREFNLRAVQLSSGQEWRRPDLARASGMAFVVPLNFPELPQLPEEEDWSAVSLDQLRAWDWAPENAALLRQQDIEIALTTWLTGQKPAKSAWPWIGAFPRRCPRRHDARSGPAPGCGPEARLIEPRKLANLTVVEREGFSTRRTSHGLD